MHTNSAWSSEVQDAIQFKLLGHVLLKLIRAFQHFMLRIIALWLKLSTEMSYDNSNALHSRIEKCLSREFPLFKLFEIRHKINNIDKTWI